MADTLNIFGTEYTNVAGIIAYDDNGDEVTYLNGGGAPSLQTKSKTYTPTTSQQTESVTADGGYDGLDAVNITVNAIPSTYVQPTSTVGTTTYRASTSNQTISAGTYHSGAATIAAVSQTNLTAANIKSGTTISISNGQSNIWSVTGTYSGGGTEKNVQAYRGYATVSTTSYTETTVKITVAKAGTYNVSWMGYRSYSSGTFGSQLYKNGTAVGTANTTFLNTYGHSVSLSNQTFAKDDVLIVRARAGATNRYMGVGNLIIEEV